MKARTVARGRSPGRHKLVLLAALAFALVLGLVFVESAFAVTKTYNLYATDTYITMADGTIVYCYGFVGGEAGKPLTFQNSMKTPKGVVPGSNVTLAGGAPNPTPGLMTAQEQPLFGNAQFPAPVIYAAVGDVVEIRLKNLGVSNGAAPNDPHTIHLHGLDVSAANDGVPETSLAAVPANAKRGAPGAGNVVVYMFAPEYPGTYMYHCHQEADIHVQMGMYGALVVYSAADVANPNSAYNNGGPGNGKGGDLFGWKYDKDYLLLLSEFDLGQHTAEQFAGAAGGYNPVNYKPQYWFVNGLSFPNTIHAGAGAVPFNWTNWSASHPNYDPFIVGSVNKVSSAGTRGEKVLLRVINMGFQTQPMHMHGYHAKVIGSDQRAWPWTWNTADAGGINNYGKGLEKNTLTVGSGETYEWIIDFGQQKLATGRYDAVTGTDTVTAVMKTQSRYDPVTLLPKLNTDMWAGGTTYYPAIPDMFVPGFAYIGGSVVGPVLPLFATTNPANPLVPVPVGQGTLDAAGLQPALPPEVPVTTGQYFPFHNHDDYKATNNGIYPGGQFTMIMTTQ